MYANSNVVIILLRAAFPYILDGTCCHAGLNQQWPDLSVDIAPKTLSNAICYPADLNQQQQCSAHVKKGVKGHFDKENCSI